MNGASLMASDIKIYTISFVVLACIMLLLSLLLSPNAEGNRELELFFRLGVAFCICGFWFLTCFAITICS